MAIAVAAVAALGEGGYGVWRGIEAPTPAGDARPVTPSEASLDSQLSLARSSLDQRDYRGALAHAGAVLATDANHAERRKVGCGGWI